MEDPSSVDVDTSISTVQVLSSSLHGDCMIGMREWSELDGDSDSFSDIEINALLHDTIVNIEDQEIIKGYLREELNLAESDPLNNIPSDLIMDLLDIDNDNDNDFDGVDTEKIKTS